MSLQPPRETLSDLAVDVSSSKQPEPLIRLKEWNSNTPYLRAIKAVPLEKAYSVYLTQRKSNSTSPAFYVDCAEYFFREKKNALGVLVLSNLAELDDENPAFLRVLAYRLMQLGESTFAKATFEKILIHRPEEPQSLRDLALACSSIARKNSDLPAYKEAMAYLARLIKSNWDRFEGIEVIALMELNALYEECIRKFSGENIKFPLDPKFKKNLDLDVRILLTWDADATDIDLHVIEPSGEQAMYDHNRTTIGGLVSKDFTDGYGPEEYCLRKAMSGTYKINVNYYSSHSVELLGPVTVQAEVITNFGRPNENRKALTLRLAKEKESILVGEIKF